MVLKRLLAGVWLVFVAVKADAHRLPYSYLDLRFSDGELRIDLKINSWELAGELKLEESLFYQPSKMKEAEAGILSHIKERLHFRADGRALDYQLVNTELVPSESMVLLQMKSLLPSDAQSLEIACDLMHGVPNHSTYLKMYRDPGDPTPPIILNESRSRYAYRLSANRSKWAVAIEFIKQGVHHIFIGPDHIAFILGLVLLGGSIVRIAQIVTAFTLAHSVTLSMAALGLVSIPDPVIELLVAASIVYIGVENLTHHPGRKDRRAAVAFLFGFVHGFGFANVLRDLGLPSSALWLSLLCFNLGVEAGQLGIVLLTAPLFSRLRDQQLSLPRLNRSWSYAQCMSMGIILAGGYWLSVSGSGWVQYLLQLLRL